MSEGSHQSESSPTSPTLSKADFRHLYNQPGPRPYIAQMKSLEYRIQQLALPFLNRVLDVLSTTPRDGDDNQQQFCKILDVCCSYGLAAALLRYDASLDDLTLHYASTSSQDLTYQEQVAIDRQFFASPSSSRLRQQQQQQDDHPHLLEVIGVDIAPNAIRYATETGLLSRGWVEDLEVAEPSDDLREALRDVRLVMCTGGVGYVGAATFGRIAAANDHPERLWMVVFVLRIYPFDEIEAELARFGLVVDKIPGVVLKQRRFVSEEEQRAAAEAIKVLGLDPFGLEEDGWYYAECFLIRPAENAHRHPVTSIFFDLAGGGNQTAA